MTEPSDLRAHERPKPPKVKRACGRCDPDWNDDFTKRVVVSPDGVAHFAQSDGTTECGIDATRDDWWRRPAMTVPPDVRALVKPIHDMIDEGLGWHADYDDAMAALSALLDRLARLQHVADAAREHVHSWDSESPCRLCAALAAVGQ